jgi:endonuclease/exonuclease/phosphatase (EEP) superfamily protein YafD
MWQSIVLSVGNIILFFMPLCAYESITELTDVKNSKNIKIISANVLYSNTDYKKAIDVITKENPDIIALIEPTETWIEKFDALKKKYTYSMKKIKANHLGLAVYSKLPFKKEQFIDIGNYDSTIAYVEFDRFNLIVVHPIPPVTYDTFQDNKNYIQTVAQYVENTKKSVIVTGDFNNTLWSEPTKELYNVGLRRINPYGIAYTWPVQVPFLALQIDHFFSKGIKQADFKILPNIGSDHYPIQTIVNFE